MAVRADRTPARRGSDRFEDLATWVLLAAGMFLILFSCIVGVRVHGNLADQARVEAQDRTPAVARLLAAAPTIPSGYAADDLAAVAATWPDPSGGRHTGSVMARQGQQAGSTVSIWIDRTGAPVSPPISTANALLAGATVATTVLAVGVAALAGLWMAVRRAVLAYNCARWEREWREVAPIWSKGNGLRG